MVDIARKLVALSYPRAASFTLEDEREVMMLVVWTEDRHIRALDIEARGPLRKMDGSGAWNAAFSKYLHTLDCPLLTDAGVDAASMPDFIRWLVQHAISLQYEDKAAVINDQAAAQLADARRASSLASEASTTASALPADAAATLREVAALLHVSTEARGNLHTLQAIHRVIRQRLLPAVSAQSAAAAVPVAGSGAATRVKGGSLATRRGASTLAPSASDLLDVSAFPVGFSTGDAVVDKAAALLRMLYVTDLRELQDAITEILIAVQEFTANPKTDAKLGVVGH